MWPITGARRYCGASGSIIGGIEALGTSLYAGLVPSALVRLGLTTFHERWVAQLKSRADSASEVTGVDSVTTARP